jgi:DNA polymerase (family 10)
LVSITPFIFQNLLYFLSFSDKIYKQFQLLDFMKRGRVRRAISKLDKSHGQRVLHLAKKILKELKPFCSRVEVAGSIRRKKPNPGDIDIVLVAKSEKHKKMIKEKLIKQGKFLQGGSKEMFFRVQGVDVELFFTVPDEWGAALMAYSGRKGSNIGLRMVAMRKGLKLTNHGLFNRTTGKRIAGKTEREIYHALGRQYREPWDR